MTLFYFKKSCFTLASSLGLFAVLFFSSSSVALADYSITSGPEFDGLVSTTNDSTYSATKFTVTTAGTVSGIVKADFCTYSSSPGGTVSLYIQTDNAGSPSGTVVGNSAAVSNSLMNSGCGGSNAVNASFDFSGSPASLTPGDYWLVWKTSGLSGMLQAQEDAVNVLGGSKYTTNDGATWANAGHDQSNILISVVTGGGGGGGGGGGNGFTAELASTTAGFGATTGFQIGDVISWSGSNLIGLFIGSGLAILLSLRYWIAALLVIASIIYFVRRAYAFFRT